MMRLHCTPPNWTAADRSSPGEKTAAAAERTDRALDVRTAPFKVRMRFTRAPTSCHRRTCSSRPKSPAIIIRRCAISDLSSSEHWTVQFRTDYVSRHRCGLTNEDLNRRWSKPSPVLHPSIYHTKGLIEYLLRVWRKPPLVFCDYHGHSRKKNVFFYGCAGAESWCSSDRIAPDEPVKYLMLPALMHRISGAFALGSCSFRVERERESTARVTVWRHLAVARSYTMEASFCGFDQGPYKGFHLNTQHLQGVGSDLCEALGGLSDGATVDIQLTRELNGEKAVDSEQGSGSDSVLKTDSDEDFD
ncbi:unnamed protein product, partial [Iphiclides podalirius]